MKKARKPLSDVLVRAAINVRQHREALQLTERQLARRSKIPVSDIRGIERAQVNFNVAKLEALQAALDCTARDLLQRPPKTAVRKFCAQHS